MINILKVTKTVIIFIALILSSCATPSRVGCPSFDTGKINNFKKYKSRVNKFNFSKKFGVKNRYKPKREKFTKSNFVTKPTKDLNVLVHDSITQNEIGNQLILGTVEPASTCELNRSESYGSFKVNYMKIQKQKILLKTKNINMNISSKISKKDSVNSKIIKANSQNIAERKNAKIIGGALLLMAFLSGIAFPALGTLTASLGLIGVFILDIFVSFGIYKYHKKEKPKLAKVSGILRILYTSILGIGIGYHIMGNVPMFNSIWGIGLIAFGVHLITLGILFNNNNGKKWVNILIKSLLIIAGIGYMIQYIGILIVPNPIGFAVLIESLFIIPMVLGEVFYALWMLIKGGKIRKSEVKNS